jgi:hypothetical protein
MEPALLAFRISDELAGSPIAYGLRPWVARTVRIGYAAKGVIYLLIETLAFRLAAGLDASHPPFGWALAAAIAACFGLFQLLHARYARL